MTRIDQYLGLLVTLGLALTTTSHAQIKLIDGPGSNRGWTIFGPPLNGGNIVKRNNELRIQVDWPKTSWGVGISRALELPVDGRKVKGIRAEIKTLGTSNVRVHAGLSNKAGGNLSQDMRLAEEVTTDWKLFEFSAAEMMPELFASLSPTFGNLNQDKVIIVNLFFLKPRNNVHVKGSIIVRNPVLIYSEEDVYVNNY